MNYGIEMKMKQVIEDPEAAAIFERYIPGMLARAGGKEAASLSIQMISGFMGGTVTEQMLSDMDKELKALGESRGGISPAQRERMDGYCKMAVENQNTCVCIKENVTIQDAIYPGRVVYDNTGRRIEAHGGGFLFEDGYFYWYGENKQYTDGTNDIWTWGIRMYRSKDFYNWEDMGLVAEPDLENPESALFPEKNLDRPHIVKHPETGQYILWAKLSGNDGSFLVMRAEVITGPYILLEQDIMPFNLHVGDFDLVLDDSTGRGYIYAETEHSEVTGFLLNENLTKIEAVISHSYCGLKPPFCREGISVFQYNGKLWMLSSGMTGYVPNQSDLAVADSFTSEFVSVGDPHVNDDSLSSFNSQIGQVFKMPGKDNLYITIADRWVPDYIVDKRIADLFRRTIASNYDPEHYQATEDEFREMREAPTLTGVNTHHATYVLLPIRFDEGVPRIYWRDSWKLEDFLMAD